VVDGAEWYISVAPLLPYAPVSNGGGVCDMMGGSSLSDSMGMGSDSSNGASTSSSV